MSFAHEDLGIDLERVKRYPTCEACRRKTDTARVVHGVTLCTTHYDEFAWERIKNPELRAGAYALNLRATKYRACWEAREES